MHRLARRFVDRDLPLVVRFRRGVRAGFAVAAAIALATLVLTELTSSAVERGVSAQADLGDQRAEVARVGNRLALLADAEGSAAQAALRVEIGAALESLAARQVDLQIDHGSLLTTEVEIDGAVVRFDHLFEDAVEQVELAVAALAGEGVGSADRADGVAGALESLAVLDLVYADHATVEVDGALATAARLRRIGRWLGAVAVLAACLRLVVLGRPLVRELEVERGVHAEAERRMRESQVRSVMSSKLTEGLEAVDDEAGVRRVVARTLERVMADHPAEMLLADSSKARLTIHARNPARPVPGCGVQSPWSCPAVRRAATRVFEDSEGIQACQHLVGRSTGPCSAVCVPVSFIGDSMGVLHVTGDPGWVPDPFEIDALEMIAGQSAMRLGAIRSFRQAELQASTDVLTGLPNRRAVEERISRFLVDRDRGAIAMADLDHFKNLNDSHGHEAGDRALRMFAEVLRTATREADFAGRWGGEEFVLLLPDLSAHEAVEVLDRVRTDLAAACERSDGPAVTVSIGVVDTTAASGLDALVNLADDCLYVAKEQGRDRVVVGPVSEFAAVAERGGA